MLVVIAIIGVLMALLLPAVQAAREASRRSRCANNLKQIGLAFHNFADANGAFPPARSTKTPKGGWVVSLLPYIESEPLRKSYHYDQDYNSAANRQAILTQLEFMQCPSSPERNRLAPLSFAAGNTAFGAAGDYWVHAGPVVSLDLTVWAQSPLSATQQTTSDRPARLRANMVPTTLITDGLAQTILVYELAMRPQHWIMGVRQPDPTTWQAQHSGAWAYCLAQGPKVFTADGITDRSTVPTVASTEADYPLVINANNFGGSYAFHPAGANSLFCDGSVHFFSTKMRSSVYLALATADGGDTVPDGSY
jgi:prepilin-type processing-associated H-X9-DG protein